jgi:hypothetical protein
MDNRRPKKMAGLKVREVKDFIRAYSEEQVHGVQQILGWFGESPKLERILFALLKKNHLIAKAHAEKWQREYHIRTQIDPQDSDIDVPPTGIEDDLQYVRDLREGIVERGNRHGEVLALLTDEWTRTVRATLKVHSADDIPKAGEIKDLVSNGKLKEALDIAEELMITLKSKTVDLKRKRCGDTDAMISTEKKEPVKPRFTEPEKLPFVVGVCPKCDSMLGGLPLPSCETKKTGRVFYKECSSCEYYAEVWKKTKQKRTTYYQEEGG